MLKRGSDTELGGGNNQRFAGGEEKIRCEDGGAREMLPEMKTGLILAGVDEVAAGGDEQAMNMLPPLQTNETWLILKCAVPCRFGFRLSALMIGDKRVLFADKVLKFTGSGKMKRRILLITDFAIYVVDPMSDVLKRRIALAAVDKLCLSKLSDNFFAINIPTEYDCFMASARKTEIVTVLVEAIKSMSDYELEVVFSNRFEYHASADLVKEVQFEEVEGGIKTRILRK
ncbi:hypothetical protein HHK36_000109 [Tetracentron sinense]|uniref:TH1 domain-containing protein n=1 Tax=Tetracentron sinense TaxID=13715 RepID=A0A835DPQ8_TETSI|nr:hypothetical protein HHK36_000109 [Tetracentron sinense]